MPPNVSSLPPDLTDLEFPDRGGMDGSPQHLSPAAAFAFIKQYARWFPEAVHRCRENRPMHVPVKFTL